MRLNDAPKHDCPDCQQHPPLVYANSVEPTHFYQCAMCGQQYRATSGGEPIVTPSNQVVKPPEVECFGCGGFMRVKMVAKGSVPEEALVWQCTQCGTQEKFKH